MPEDAPKVTPQNTSQNTSQNMLENTPKGTPSVRDDPNACSKTCPKIVTADLKDAVAKGYLKKIPPDSDLSPSDSDAENGQDSPGSPSSEIIIVRNVNADAPNILLNSHDQFGRGEVRLVAVIGTVIQLGILIYSGFATYYYTLKFPKDEQPVAGYAFPCTAAGTLILVVGMLLCAYIVESSTEEHRYRPGEGRKARLVWLQQTKTVSDQVFISFAVIAANERKLIMTSQRLDKKSLKLTTMLGTMVSLYGLFLQFIGLRGMHWSASATQLGAVILMTSLRVWVRRRLAKPPLCKPLTSGFELDWFAMRLGDNKNPPWRHASSAAVFKSAKKR